MCVSPNLYFTGASALIYGSIVGVYDGYQAITDDENRTMHIAALAMNILTILGATLMIAGGAHCNLPLVFVGCITSFIGCFSRIVLSNYIENRCENTHESLS